MVVGRPGGGGSAAGPGLARGGLQAVDGLHLVADEELNGGGARGDLPKVAAVQRDRRAVGQVDALDGGDQVAVLGEVLQAAAQRGGVVVADAVLVAQAHGVRAPQPSIVRSADPNLPLESYPAA
jgi:hypothetical protein